MSDLNDSFPQVGIDVKARVNKEGEKYRWTVEMHFVGPDSAISENSKLFQTREGCTVDLINKFPKTIESIMGNYS